MPAAPIPLSPAGPNVSRVVAGAMNLARWNLSPEARLRWIETCLDLGITTFDHADIYGDYTCEALFGDALSLTPGLRARMQLVSKCGIKLVSPNRPEHALKQYDTSRGHIIDSTESSLRYLRTDHLDLLLIHRPDPLLDADAVAAAFVELHQSGKVRHFGVSNFRPRQFDLLASRLPFRLVTNQIEFSVAHLTPLEDGTLDHLQKLRLAPMVWSPLAGGRIFRPDTPKMERLSIVLQELGRLYQADVDQVALAWLLLHPSRPVPVLGTGRPERLAAAVAATQLSLRPEAWFRIWQASTGHEVP